MLVFTIVKWTLIITASAWAINHYLYPKLDSFIDIQKTTTSIQKDIHDGIRANQPPGQQPPNNTPPN